MCIRDRDHILLVYELIKSGTLQDYVRAKRRLDLSTSLKIMKQLAEATFYLHSMNIMHRDLKLMNILISPSGEKEDVGVKICDLGLTTYVNEVPYIFHKCGTPGYVAPEIFKSRPGVPYSVACDIFSLGVIFFSLLTGELPFEGLSLIHI
eukprot:TRINITY_DN24955_c0_g1_i2.p1 TRINITY_DN24955_c0_g1~~TRINITY_DN24955_c0_g1_i2.p1  ORF type:complete len:169 (+),score=29.77 TRINITY_DN24955_c0_g1_i2:60-509(+)